MEPKTKMTKLQRKRLERELIRNHRQRKENKREVNRLFSLYPAYSVLSRKRTFIPMEDEEDSATTGRVYGESVRGLLA
jgi:hypothetical protein